MEIQSTYFDEDNTVILFNWFKKFHFEFTMLKEIQSKNVKGIKNNCECESKNSFDCNSHRKGNSVKKSIWNFDQKKSD